MNVFGSQQNDSMPPWTLKYDDDLIVTTEKRQVAMQRLEGWRERLESNGLKVNMGPEGLELDGTQLKLKASVEYRGSNDRVKAKRIGWTTKKDDLSRLESNEMRMLRWAAGFSLRDRKRNEDIRRMLGNRCTELIAQRRLRWFNKVMNSERRHISIEDIENAAPRETDEALGGLCKSRS
ncbi:hypothetical protein ACOME3_008691 [Neoechinorhynchus agilis]